ncbi:MAG: PQQ-binding-like beta-propeller repeat protein, partial [Candidatus Aureabacteria bacterium]|nr:PQQ-binding-like beta-propeller repeat protein [Candidatus Auribacterota bacterium]
MLGAVWGAGMAFGAGAAPAAGVASDYNDQWPAWRGPEANGVARNADPPVKWDEKTNVKWKVEIPGSGHASPIVWKDRVFVLTSIPSGEKSGSGDQKPAGAAIPGIPMKNPGGVRKFEVLCLDRKDHSTVWRRTVAEKAPHAATHADGSWASGSPVTDGERLYAFFGSNGLYCLDMNGKPLWEKDLGQMKVRFNFGEGSSPVLCGDRLIVNWDHEAGSFIVAFDKKTGDPLWKSPREEATSWATPMVVDVGGKPQVITSATKAIRSYDPATGAVIWECGGMTQNVIPSPATGGGMAYMMSGYKGNALLCVDLSKAKGDITNSPAILWKHDRDTPYAPSPLLYDNMLYFLKSNIEELSCFDAKTGKPHFNAQKLEGLK